MDEKALSMTIFTLLGLLAAFTYSFFDPTLILLGSEIKLPISIFTILNFFFGTIFFGYLAFLPAILMGLNLGAQKNAAIFLYIIPIVISTYAGTKLGFGIEKILEKDNYLPTIKNLWNTIHSNNNRNNRTSTPTPNSILAKRNRRTRIRTRRNNN